MNRKDLFVVMARQPKHCDHPRRRPRKAEEKE